MLIKTKGIVLRSLKYSETSIIADIFTEEKGLRSYLFSGVRSRNAKIKASLLQPMSLVEMVAYERQEKGLNRVRELQAAYVFQAIPFDLRKGAVGLFLAEIARKVIREPEENRPLFDFLFRSFRFLDGTGEPVANIHLYFLLELSYYLGFVPGGEWAPETPFFDMQEGTFTGQLPAHPHYLQETESQLLSRLLDCRMENCHEVAMGRRERKALLRHLLDYYRLHIENLPEINAHLILEEVLGE
ncbi:MAG: DNA repair protein RecO [Phaeodactylibacter sp.]|nr:DNA repair protein RecO [Phaeodactylibacter sp.]MCB9275052.1 DNA repair protein RecO [Lewinellaceae bacterium]